MLCRQHRGIAGRAGVNAEVKPGRMRAALEQAGQLAIPLESKGSERLVESKAARGEPREDAASADADDPAPLSPDRALVLTDIDVPESTPGERLLRLAYRMGIPGSTLVSPFRKPARLRLLGKVETPLAGRRAAGVALRAGHFYVYGVKLPFAQVDMGPLGNLSPPFERTVHGFTWLRDLASGATLPQARPVAQRLLSSWLDANATPGKGPAWDIENAGLRLLAWLVHAPLIVAPKGNPKAEAKSGAAREQTLAAMEQTARFLDRKVRRADDRLGEVIGWSALCAAGLLLPEGGPRLLYAEAGLARALGEAVGEDGGVLSRSGEAQMQAMAALIDLRACYAAMNTEPPRLIEAMLALLTPPLLALLHSDGGLGNWQGSGAVRPSRVAALIAASGVRARPLNDPEGWGYQRLSAREATLIMDGAPPPDGRHARHGCASTLAFEFSHGENRLIVNCGGAAMAGGQVPVRIEQGLRATAAHSTLVLGDANSTAVLIDGKLGAGVNEVAIDTRQIAQGAHKASSIEATHDGYAARFGLLHRRMLMLRSDGDELRGEDVLIPSGRKGARGKVPFAIRFHLGSRIEATLAEGARSVSLATPDGQLWQFLAGEQTLSVDESLWVDGNGRPHPVQQIVIQGLASRGGGSFAWLLKRMG